jgi:hypothetical protein
MSGFYKAVKLGTEIAKVVYCNKNTDKSGTFAT